MYCRLSIGSWSRILFSGELYTCRWWCLISIQIIRYHIDYSVYICMCMFLHCFHACQCDSWTFNFILYFIWYYPQLLKKSSNHLLFWLRWMSKKNIWIMDESFNILRLLFGWRWKFSEMSTSNRRWVSTNCHYDSGNTNNFITKCNSNIPQINWHMILFWSYWLFHSLSIGIDVYH